MYLKLQKKKEVTNKQMDRKQNQQHSHIPPWLIQNSHKHNSIMTKQHLVCPENMKLRVAICKKVHPLTVYLIFSSLRKNDIWLFI